MKNGVPYDVAFSLAEADVAAYAIIFGEMEGQKFDWNAWGWEKRE